MGIIVVIHVIGLFGLLLWAMSDDGSSRREWRPGDGGRGQSPERTPPATGPDGIALPDAVQSPIRLREPGRIGDWRLHTRPMAPHPPQRTPRRKPPVR